MMLSAAALLPVFLAAGCGRDEEPEKLESPPARLTTDTTSKPDAGTGDPPASTYGIDEFASNSLPTPAGTEPGMITAGPEADTEVGSTSGTGTDTPSTWYGHYDSAIALQKQGDFAAAEKHFRESIALKPDFTKSHVNLSRVLNEAGRFDEALEEAEKALELSPGDAAGLHLKGRSLANLNRIEEAETALRESLEADPAAGHVWNRLGLLLIQAGRFEDATPVLERAVELIPEVGYVRNNLGIAYERNGRMRDAEVQFAAGLDREPENVKLQANLARVRVLPDGTFVAQRPISGYSSGKDRD
jgi:Flp pilus assembly protein TadD